MNLGMKVAGWVFLIATAVGFEIENAWLFVAGAILCIAWVGAVLRPSSEA